MSTFALTVFLGSFLLFQIQPLIGKYILPWFGGTPAVWTTCMLFFQTALLAGYAYAHGASLLQRKKQIYLHLALLTLSLLFFHIAPSEIWKPFPGDEPITRILLLLAATIGIPYLILASTAPLTQHWFSKLFPGKSPYRLYAVSNASSLLALLTYPFLVEPHLPLVRQAQIWGGLFFVYVLLNGWCAAKLLRTPAGIETVPGRPETGDGEASSEQKAGPGSFMMWILLSACGSALLVSVTNQLCQEVAVVPFLWVLPLVLYLATFTIVFSRDKTYDRVLWGLLLAGALIPGVRVLDLGVNVSLPAQIIIYLAVLFTLCMVCHGELAAQKPAPRQLTGFYLAIALGGAIGGASVAIAAPLLLSSFGEYPIAVSAACLAITVSWYRQGLFNRMPHWLWVPVGAGVAAVCLSMGVHLLRKDPGEVYHSRNFYGVLRVLRQPDKQGEKMTLMHGRVAHGSQFTTGTLSRLAISYYGDESGAGLALRYHPLRQNPNRGDKALKAGVVGLGAGTLAAYGRAGDTFRFYEINPDVIRISDRYFSYRRDSAAAVEIVEGDARIMMEAELQNNNRQKFDVLMIDAFSSDAIPIHLLTRECFEVYRRHLNPDGLLLFHITNRFLDLAPVVATHAAASQLQAVMVTSRADPSMGIWKADWIVVTGNERFLAQPEVKSRSKGVPASSLLWTDDFAGLWQVMRK